MVVAMGVAVAVIMVALMWEVVAGSGMAMVMAVDAVRVGGGQRDQRRSSGA
jgi:hypothetical protein